MGDIAALLPDQPKTVQAIYNHYKKTGDAEPRRGYLGASQIGHGCTRYLWYSFRWCGREEIDGRMYRLFDRGDMEEYRIVNDLRAIGCTVHDVNEETGEQFAVSALAGHFTGHLDGCLLGLIEALKTWHVLEIKTHNAKSFAYLKQNGVQKAKKMHYDQMQVYMHLMGMDRALYMACNKDTDELYQERVRYDKKYAERLMLRAERIIKCSGPAPYEQDNPPADSKVCDYCPFVTTCKGGGATAVKCNVNCRTCAHAQPEMDGDARWTCSLNKKDLSVNDQNRACPNHIFVPGLVTFAQATESGQNHDKSVWIEYANRDGSVWRNGSDKKDGQYSSIELTRVSFDKVGRGAIHDIKKAFGGEIIREEAEHGG